MTHDEAINLLIQNVKVEDHEDLREFIGLPNDMICLKKADLWALVEITNAIGIASGKAGSLGALIMEGCVQGIEAAEVGFLRKMWHERNSSAQVAIKLLTAVALDHLGGKVKV